MNKEYTFKIAINEYKTKLKDYLSELQEALLNSSIEFSNDKKYLLLKTQIFSLNKNKPINISKTENLLREMGINFNLTDNIVKL